MIYFTFTRLKNVFRYTDEFLYSRLPIIRIFKGNRKTFELSGVRVIEGSSYRDSRVLVGNLSNNDANGNGDGKKSNKFD